MTRPVPITDPDWKAPGNMVKRDCLRCAKPFSSRGERRCPGCRIYLKRHGFVDDENFGGSEIAPGRGWRDDINPE